MDQTTLGIGTRLQHTQHGPDVIVGVRYATYIISVINVGIKEIDTADDKLMRSSPRMHRKKLKLILKSNDPC